MQHNAEPLSLNVVMCESERQVNGPARSFPYTALHAQMPCKKDLNRFHNERLLLFIYLFKYSGVPPREAPVMCLLTASWVDWRMILKRRGALHTVQWGSHWMELRSLDRQETLSTHRNQAPSLKGPPSCLLISNIPPLSDERLLAESAPLCCPSGGNLQKASKTDSATSLDALWTQSRTVLCQSSFSKIPRGSHSKSLLVDFFLKAPNTVWKR